jgi:integrase/recombinase XerD
MGGVKKVVNAAARIGEGDTLVSSPSSVPFVPSWFSREGDSATRRVLEFFTAQIRNPNTRQAYAHAVHRFAEWNDGKGFRLTGLKPFHVAAYVEQLGNDLAKPSVKQHLAAIRMLFDYLVIGQVVEHNPASSVRGPKYVLKMGKTPVLSKEEMKQLLAVTVPQDTEKMKERELIARLRDRALIGVLFYSFARISAVLHMNVEDYWQQGKRSWFRLHEKGGKDHDVPVHHTAVKYLDEYLDAAKIAAQKGTPLFRTLDQRRRLTEDRISRREALAMVKRRGKQAGVGDRLGCHSFRATGITVYLSNGGTIEHAQAIAAHESPRTTKLYDRTSDELTLDEIEKIIL